MKRLIKSFNISENTIDKILMKLYEKYNSNELYLNLMDFKYRRGPISIDSEEDMFDYYGYEGGFNEWLNDSIAYGYFSLLDRDWLKQYLSDKSKEDIKKEFPILYNIMNRIEEDKEDEELSENDKFLKECENSGNFDEYQIFQIRWGLNNLSLEKVKLYAIPSFESGQMSEARLAFMDDNFSIDEVKIFFKPSLHGGQMRLMRMKLKELKEKNKIDKLLEIDTSPFNYYQLEQIILGIEINLPKEYILQYTDFNLSADEMEKKRLKLIKEYFSNFDNFKEEENFENDE